MFPLLCTMQYEALKAQDCLITCSEMGVYVVRLGAKILVGMSCLKSQAGRRLINHRTVECLELEVTHRDHRVQALAHTGLPKTQTLCLRALPIRRGRMLLREPKCLSADSDCRKPGPTWISGGKTMLAALLVPFSSTHISHPRNHH